MVVQSYAFEAPSSPYAVPLTLAKVHVSVSITWGLFLFLLRISSEFTLIQRIFFYPKTAFLGS